jgi:NhaP-type Na+/H+ or K+/H+ antiporter
MRPTLWFIVVGALLVLMAVSRSVLRRLPVTTALIYLVVGFLLDPAGLTWAALDPLASAALLERITEVAVLVSLFTAGLKLRAPWLDRRWLTPVRLATLSMLGTVAGVAVAGVLGLGLPLGAAVLLGAVLAPTDPVLASDVQVESATDRDRLRFALTGEAGMNDGAAFPFVMLGLGLLGLHELGAWGWRWLAVDVLWASVAGLGVGWGLGTLIGRFVLYLRQTHREAVGLDDLLALGLIALAYGLALAVHGYGFLAVFAAGIALRRVEERATTRSGTNAAVPPDVAESAVVGRREEIATDPATAPAYMAAAALGVTEQLERIGEVAVVLLLGGMLSFRYLTLDALWFAPLLFLVIRPLSVRLGAPMGRAPGIQRRLVMWFGIRGIGSIYYLMYAIEHGLPEPLAERLTALTLTTVACSIVVHGISVMPLMRRYARVAGDGAGAARYAPTRRPPRRGGGRYPTCPARTAIGHHRRRRSASPQSARSSASSGATGSAPCAACQRRVPDQLRR